MAQRAPDRSDILYRRYKEVLPHQHAEIVRGTLYVMARPGPKHASAASMMGVEIGGPFQRGRGGPGGWWILFEPEIHFAPKEPVVPDLAGWRAERMPELPDEAFFSLPPDWVCEVLSPSTTKVDRDEKLPLYAEHRVPYVWLVDPIAKILEVHTLDQEEARWSEVRVYQGDDVIRAAPFDAIELELAALWSSPRSA
jgi:Uma2 family endonuclease